MTTSYIVRIHAAGLDMEELDITAAVLDCAKADGLEVGIAALCLWENIAEANPGKDVNMFEREIV